MIACIIFDCDGTLVDSEELGNRVLSDHFDQHGVSISAESLVEEFRGGHFAQMLETIEARFETTLPENFIPEFRRKSDVAYEQHLQPIEGAELLLRSLSLPRCVASNAPIKKTKRSLELTGLAPFVGDNLFSAYSINAWKPEPDLFLHAAEQMGFAAHECLVVEDSAAGAMAGVAANMRTVLLDPENTTSCEQVSHRIASLAEIPELLSELSAN